MSNKTKINQKNNECFTCVREKIESVYSVAWYWEALGVKRSWASELLEIVGSVHDSRSRYCNPIPFDHASTVQSDNIPLGDNDAIMGVDDDHRNPRN